MIILGIESTCDETAAALVEDGRHLLSNVISTSVKEQALYGGVVPEIASRRHCEFISATVKKALLDAGKTIDDVDAVAVTFAPGLIGAVLVGVNFAKSFAFANSVPLVAVDHIKAHVAAAYLADAALTPPFLAVVVSGGHTAVFDVRSETDFHLIGTTRDDAAGEAFDKIGRVIGLPYPGGAALDKLAYEGDPHAVRLPSPALGGDTLDFSFSGLKTAALNEINLWNQKGIEVPRADLAASFTEAVVSGIAAKASAALSRTGRKTLVLAGGVAANSHLRARLAEVCAAHGARLSVPPISLCGDNGAMVAMAGSFEFLAGRRAGTDLNASAADNGK